jgi:isopentenyl diphosphate isomerase/L-lactate dehydrogenase-like FMN-dependent dehydrogenase
MKRAKSFRRVLNIEDLRYLAQKRLPRVVFDYLDGGAEGETTLAANRLDFQSVAFRPRHAVDVGSCDLRTQVLNTNLSMPIILAPIGYSRLIHPGGDISAARAAGAAGTAYILSTISGYPLGQVRSDSCGPVWYQLYLLGGREAAEAAIHGAQSSGFGALIVTIDTPLAGMRERDWRNGMKELMSNDLLSKLPFLPQFIFRPRWLLEFLLDGGVPALPNVVIPGQPPMSMIDVSAALAETAVKWPDLRWIRDLWHGAIAVKGVMTPEDARRAIDHGANAIVVSNHGGRQLDGVPSSVGVLPDIVAEVNDEIDVLMDGGIRRGSDVVKAIALGAKAVLIGRAYAYGLATAGQRGIARSLEILRDEIERTLILLGCKSVSDLNRSYISVLQNAPNLDHSSCA